MVGAPAILWAVGKDLIPDHLPSLGEAWDALMGQDTGRLFIGALVLIGAVAWVVMIVALVLEIPAVLAGRTRPTDQGDGMGAKHGVRAAVHDRHRYCRLEHGCRANPSTPVRRRSARPRPSIEHDSARPPPTRRWHVPGRRDCPDRATAADPHRATRGDDLVDRREEPWVRVIGPARSSPSTSAGHSPTGAP